MSSFFSDSPADFLAELASSFPRLVLGCWPTPVVQMACLGRKLGVDLWVKRDDLSGESYGGNKVRKLELLLAEAQSRGSRSVVTVGGIGSNHVIATAVYARSLGLKTHAVVFPQPMTPSVTRTLELARALGVVLVPCSGRGLVPYALAKARREAERPFLIGPGGSSPLGTLGFVAAAFELRQQVLEGILPEPDVLFVALGSGGTMAGLTLGLALAGMKTEVVGVRVVERVLINATWLRLLVRRTIRLLQRHGLTGPVPARRCVVRHDQFGGTYGRSTKAAEAAVELALAEEGLKLETTYTGKTLASLLSYCKDQGKRQRLLFWNTYNSRDTTPLLK